MNLFKQPGSDTKLIVAGRNNLRWVAIDETHSYTGAGAAELAMLLRRVLLAFKVDAQDIRFATSSATFGNGEDKEKDERELKEFIAGITGIRADQVEAWVAAVLVKQKFHKEKMKNDGKNLPFRLHLFG